ncbi:unnamed protein product, partial [Leptidea sinapis]
MITPLTPVQTEQQMPNANWQLPTATYKLFTLYTSLADATKPYIMPPKETAKKPTPQIHRPNISESSLNFVPEEAIKGFQERIEHGVNWTLLEEAGRYHRQKCQQKKIQNKSFSEALMCKISKSILHNFLDESSTLSLQQQWEVLLPTVMWDNEKFTNEEGKICFDNVNCITDNMVPLIRRAVYLDERAALKNDLKLVNVLRVTDSEMTELDVGLKDFKRLVTLNLSCNFLEDIDTRLLPDSLRLLELQANRIKSLSSFSKGLSTELVYIGLSRNMLSNESCKSLLDLPRHLTVVDLSANDIYDLNSALDGLVHLYGLTSLQLIGNPCSVCAAYARTTLLRLPRLQWLDCREVLPSDRPQDGFEPHPDDLRSGYFNFSVFRIMSVPQPPKPEK